MKKINSKIQKLIFLLVVISFSFVSLVDDSFSFGVSHRNLKQLKYEITNKIISMNESLNSSDDAINPNNLNYLDTNNTNMSVSDPEKAYTSFSAVCEKERSDQIYFLNLIWLRFSAEVSLKVVLVSLKVVPSLGFIWGRTNPTGWKNY